MWFSRKKKISLILPGGGIKCAAQLGPLLYLKEKGYDVELVSAVSAGSINGAAFVSGEYELQKAVDIWKQMKNNGIYKKWKLSYLQSFHKGGIYSNTPFEQLMNDNIDLHKINNSKIKLFVGATSKLKKKMRWWNNVDGFTSIDPFVASCAFPIFFPPKMIEGRLYIDGGVLKAIPFEIAFEKAKETKHFVVLRTTSMTEELLLNQSEKNNLIENFHLTFDYGHKAVIDAQMDLMLSKASKKHKVIVWRPKRKYFDGTFDTNANKINYAVEDSYNKASKFFKKHL